MRDLPNNYAFDNPEITLELLSELEAIGLTDEAFAVMHHFEKPESIASHRNYCSMLHEESANFRTGTNRLVQQRLYLMLRVLNLANIKNRSHQMLVSLAKLSTIEFPHAGKAL